MITICFSNKSSSAPTFGKVVRILRILIVLGILSVDIFTMIINYFQVDLVTIIFKTNWLICEQCQTFFSYLTGWRQQHKLHSPHVWGGDGGPGGPHHPQEQESWALGEISDSGQPPVRCTDTHSACHSQYYVCWTNNEKYAEN